MNVKNLKSITFFLSVEEEISIRIIVTVLEILNSVSVIGSSDKRGIFYFDSSMESNC